MSLQNKIINATKTVFGLGTKSSSPAVQCFVNGNDLDAPRTKLLEPYSQSPWVNIAVSVLAENLAHIPFRISRSKRGADDVIESGPVIDLFENPHPSLTRTLFWQTLVSWEALRGEFFILPLDKSDRPTPVGRGSRRAIPSQDAEKLGVSLGQPGASEPTISSLLPLNPDHFQHIVQGNHLAGWRYNCHAPQQPMQSQVLLPEEVIHARNFNPYTFWRGL